MLMIGNSYLWVNRHLGSGDPETVSASILKADVYTHVVFTLDEKQTMRLYEDGELASNPAPAALQLQNTDAEFRVGAMSDNPDPVYRFAGALDELAVYDHALPATRVKAHYDAAQP